MFRALLVTLSLAIAGGGGYLVGTGGLLFERADIVAWLPSEWSEAAEKLEGTGRIVYYRHPDRQPEYSATARKTPDGRDFTPVRQGEDVSFADVGKPKEQVLADAAPADRKILYYRNPMGLPDTSPPRRRIPWGWTTSPSSKARPTTAAP